LGGIVEQTKLKRTGPNEITDEVSGEKFSDDSLVSMNCWGFDASFMDFLGSRFSHYLDQLGSDEASLSKGEFYLPAAVDDWRSCGQGQVRVEVSEEPWLGVTYPQDREIVVAGLQERIAKGLYPAELWS